MTTEAARVHVGRVADTRAPIAPAVPVIALVVVVVLLAFASRYGYHRDELYFVAAGHHLAWAYADQGPVTPLLARVMTAIAPGSLTVLRIPSALMAGAIVYVTGLLARDLGGSSRAQWIAAACSATAILVLFDGHLLETSTVDLLIWTLLSWLVLRAIDAPKLWLVIGALLGIGLLNKALPAFLAVAVLAGLVICGPRRVFRSPWLWAGAVVALVLWSPWLIWQQAHGWPQFAVSSSIAAGGSTSSQPWWLIVPFQPLLAGPPLAVVWIVGLVRLFREQPLRFLACAWVLLAIAFMATGGKPYYLGGLLPLLIAAGAGPVERWLATRRGWRTTFFCVVGLSVVVCGTIALPVLPASASGPVIAMNPDVGETIGWPSLVHTVASVYRTAGPDAVILTDNYGEAGAIDRYGPSERLPRAYSGHNAYWYWGHPPDRSGRVVVVGYSSAAAARYLHGCRLAATNHDPAGIDNDENGAPILLCAGPRTSWSAEWRSVRHLG